jgi:flavin reductase (DIM6/NTAB) family NADH-FMN oxidoreductase RutF
MAKFSKPSPAGRRGTLRGRSGAHCATLRGMSGHGRSAGKGIAAFGERQLRDALAQFATGVTIVCARASDNRYVGFTANSFNSVSLSPPLVLWSLSHRSASLAAFMAAERYAVNVLATGQIDLARRFSRPHADRFANVPYRLGWSDAPLIDNCVAWFECRHHAQHRAGDHHLFIGEIVTVERAQGRGLVFQHGRFGASTPLERGDDAKG